MRKPLLETRYHIFSVVCELFITDEIIDEIVNCMNEKIRMQTISDHEKLETTKEEMKALFRLLYLSG